MSQNFTTNPLNRLMLERIQYIMEFWHVRESKKLHFKPNFEGVLIAHCSMKLNDINTHADTIWQGFLFLSTELYDMFLIFILEINFGHKTLAI